MLDFARAAGIELRIFINPIHARSLLAVRDAGLWPQYEGAHGRSGRRREASISALGLFRI